MMKLYSLLILCCFICVACSTFNTGNNTIQNYLLDVPLPLSKNTSTSKKVLQIATPRSAPGYDGVTMVFVRTPHVLESYTKSQWVDTPARLLQPLLIRSLETTGQFSAVLPVTGDPITGDFRLDTDILCWQQEFLSQPSQVRLVLRAQVLNLLTHQVLKTRLFEMVEPTTTEDAKGGVLAINQAVTKLLTELNQFVIATVQTVVIEK